MKFRHPFNIFMISVLVLGCSWTSTKQDKNQAPKQTYEQFKDSVNVLLKTIDPSDIDSKSKLLYNLVFNDLVHYWVGTGWDFNGTTRIPKKGNIACGYFVTNTLSDLGFDIQRIKLAQAASSEMIKTLCTETRWINGFDNFSTYMKKQNKNAIYIVGLDFHTGFIIKKGVESYFFHSNYIRKEGVILEQLQESKALQNSQTFFIGNFSENKDLLKTWGKPR